jgi:hypothetical protein
MKTKLKITEAQYKVIKKYLRESEDRDPEYGLYNSRDNEGENDDPWADEDAKIKADQEKLGEGKGCDCGFGFCKCKDKKKKLGESFEGYSNDALTDMIVNLSRYQGNEEDIQRVKQELSKRKGVSENKNIKENKKMKRVKFKSEFKDLNEALTKVPTSLKEDNNVFEMTDGNKTYKVRWEGTLEEGNAVALLAQDKTLISEDMSHMKHLMGYKSENTTGTPTSTERLTENNKFKQLLSVSKKKKLNENLEEEAELLDEGLKGFLAGLFMIFTAMASGQDIPEEKIDSIRTEISHLTPEQKNAVAKRLTPEQLKDAETKLGLKFDDDLANDLFDYSGFQAPDKAPELYLGKYGDIKAAKLTRVRPNNNGGYTYVVDISDKSYFSDVFKYIGQNNTNLSNTRIEFTYKGSPMKGKTIRYK